MSAALKLVTIRPRGWIARLSLGLLSSWIVYAQVASPAFEVASIKASPPSRGPTMQTCKGGPGAKDPSLFICRNSNLPTLISSAFDLRGYQFPSADYGDRATFEVAARIPPGTTREQFRLMLQNLIVERFRLAYHYEKKQMQVYELAVAKGGLKMKESAAPDPSAAADHESPKASPQSAGRGVSVDSEGYPILAPGQMAVVNGLARWISSETEMEQIVSMVSAELDAPVKDSTRLEGKYDFTLSWVTVRDPASDLHGPRLEEAIQKQLGLKLERTKGLVDVFVIDHVEKVPVEN